MQSRHNVIETHIVWDTSIFREASHNTFEPILIRRKGLADWKWNKSASFSLFFFKTDLSYTYTTGSKICMRTDGASDLRPLLSGQACVFRCRLISALMLIRFKNEHSSNQTSYRNDHNEGILNVACLTLHTCPRKLSFGRSPRRKQKLQWLLPNSLLIPSQRQIQTVSPYISSSELSLRLVSHPCELRRNFYPCQIARTVLWAPRVGEQTEDM